MEKNQNIMSVKENVLQKKSMGLKTSKYHVIIWCYGTKIIGSPVSYDVMMNTVNTFIENGLKQVTISICDGEHCPDCIELNKNK